MRCVDGNIDCLASRYSFLFPSHNDFSLAFDKEEDLGRVGVAVERVFLSGLDAVHIKVKLSHLKETLAHKRFRVELNVIVNL